MAPIYDRLFQTRAGWDEGNYFDMGESDEAAEAYVRQVSEAIAADEETAAYVEELERRVDLLSAEEDLPSGDSLAAELTRFLRERDEQEERDEGPDGPAS